MSPNTNDYFLKSSIEDRNLNLKIKMLIWFSIDVVRKTQHSQLKNGKRVREIFLPIYKRIRIGFLFAFVECLGRSRYRHNLKLKFSTFGFVQIWKKLMYKRYKDRLGVEQLTKKVSNDLLETLKNVSKVNHALLTSKSQEQHEIDRWVFKTRLYKQ